MTALHKELFFLPKKGFSNPGITGTKQSSLAEFTFPITPAEKLIAFQKPFSYAILSPCPYIVVAYMRS